MTVTKHFIAMVETQFKTKIERWMSDVGGEYMSDAFVNLMKEKGIDILKVRRTRLNKMGERNDLCVL